jgi:hypothetical protein
MQDFSIILSTILNPWHFVTGTLESRSMKDLTENFNNTNSPEAAERFQIR